MKEGTICDVSEKNLGATLLRKGQAVAFTSITFSQVEQHYAQIDKECLAIFFACLKFSQYITKGSVSKLTYMEVAVESDHKLPQPIFEKSLLTAPCRLQKNLLRFQRYNLEVKHKPGSLVYVEDYLSRA